MKKILAVGNNDMTTIRNYDGTKTVIDLVNGATYRMKGGVVQSMTQPCCEQPDIHWEQVGSMYFTAGDVCDDSYGVCICRWCGTVLYDEKEELDKRPIEF